MKMNASDLLDALSIMSFLPLFRLACGTNGVYVGTAMWPLHCFRKEEVAAALSTCVLLPIKYVDMKQ